MQFLSDVFVPCPVCEGRRFKAEVLAIEWNGTTVSGLLQMSVTEALARFADCAVVRSRLAPLDAVGLGYLALGQPLDTLSGGESQRLKLCGTLASLPGAAGALLLLDEPTTGLHRHDVGRLLGVLQALVDRGHSLVVIEHNADVLELLGLDHRDRPGVSPALVSAEDGIDKWAHLVRSYFKLDGHHIQFNEVRAETLREAQRNPEQHRDLIVRVAGYSDYFCDLSTALQEEIITRTEHEAFQGAGN